MWPRRAAVLMPGIYSIMVTLIWWPQQRLQAVRVPNVDGVRNRRLEDVTADIHRFRCVYQSARSGALNPAIDRAAVH